MANLDVIRTERGEIFLAAGKSLILIDPSEPSLHVEIRARDNEPLYLGSIISRSRQRGIYAGLAGQRGQTGAGTAVEGPNGVIVFKAVPDGRSRETVAAAQVTAPPKSEAPPSPPAHPAAQPVQTPPVQEHSRSDPAPAVTLTGQAPTRAPEKAPVPAPVPEKIAVVDVPRAVSAPAPEIAAAATSRAASVPRSETRSYESSMQALLERQGRSGVRSVSELTRVQDLLRQLQ